MSIAYKVTELSWVINAWLCGECYRGLEIEHQVSTVSNWDNHPCDRCGEGGEHFVIGLPLVKVITIPGLLKAWRENRLPKQIKFTFVPMMIDAHDHVHVHPDMPTLFHVKSPNENGDLESVEAIRLKPYTVDGFSCYWVAFSESLGTLFIGKFTEVRNGE